MSESTNPYGADEALADAVESGHFPADTAVPVQETGSDAPIFDELEHEDEGKPELILAKPKP